MLAHAQNPGVGVPLPADVFLEWPDATLGSALYRGCPLLFYSGGFKQLTSMAAPATHRGLYSNINNTFSHG